MKTVMKKLFSLMLVAVLLVSAVPFASADQVEAITVPVSVTLDGAVINSSKTLSVGADGVLLDEATAMSMINNTTGRAFSSWSNNSGKTVTGNPLSYSWLAENSNGYSLTINLVSVQPEPDPVPTVTCPTCNHVYNEGTNHTCAKETCPKCNVTYIKAKGHTCSIPENPVTHMVHFVADRTDRTKIFWSVEVMEGKTVYYPGITPDSDWDCLNKVGDTENYTFMGWSTNPNATSGDTTATVVRQAITGGDRTYYAIYKNVAVDPPTSSRPGNITNKDNTNKVYLHIYLNGNAATEVHSTDLMELYLMDDDTVSNAEVLRFVSDYYYTAKDSKGMEIDGLYVNTGDKGTFPQMYYTDNKVDELTGINAMRDDGHVHISVMIKNAMRKDAVKNNYTADSSNPKTGDTIMAPVAVMGLSVSALAVLFFLNKKRAY